MIDDIKKKLPYFILLITVISVITFSSFNNAYAFDVSKLQSYYQFNQTVGQNTVDNCKYTTSGICANADLTLPVSVFCQETGIIDLSCRLDANADKATGSLTPQIGVGNFTFNIWIKQDSFAGLAGSGQRYIFTSRSNVNTDSIGFYLQDDNKTALVQYVGNAATLVIVADTSNKINNTRWHMLTLTYNTITATTTTTAKIYVDGILITSGSTATPLNPSPGITLFNRVNNGSPIRANVDETAWFSETLSQSRISFLYNGGYAKNLVIGNTPADILINPNQGPKGSSVQLNGTGFSSSNLINVYYDDVFYYQLPPTDSKGSFSQMITIPTLSLGVHTVKARDFAIPANSATTGFNVTKTIPKLILTPTNGKVGSSISTSGSGFVNQAALAFRLDSKVLQTIPALPKTDNVGNFTGILFSIPQTTPGHHNINVTDGYNNNATAVLNVTSAETVTPNTGIVGTNLVINGYGFSPSHAITIKFDNDIVASATTNTDGTFLNIKIRAPHSSANTHFINSTDGSHTASSIFTTLPSLTVIPTSGKVGSIITLNGSGFSGSVGSSSGCSATGGTITISGGNTIHTFTSNGTFTVTSGTCNALVLVVAGGGGGSSGGGGAGGFQYNSSYPLTAQSYTVTVGSGGAGGDSSTVSKGSNGKNSIFGQITSIGGGGAGTLFNGGGPGSAGKNGGSGGGGGADTTGASTGGTGTVGQGNNGGTNGGFSAATFPSGGGGGSSTVGQNAQANNISGNGGSGTANSISGASVTYAGGGGGGNYNAGTSGTGGSGGGGNGASNGAAPQAGTANTGGGGGGGGAGAIGGAGGSGIVIISYPTSSSGSGSLQVSVYFDNKIIVTNPPVFYTNATGSFNNIKINVPNIPLGNYIIKAIDTMSNSASQTFTVTPFSSTAPDAVSDLHSTFINNTAIVLTWSQPNLHKNILSGYQINYTTPFGIPQIIITNNTSSSNTQFTITGLTSSTNYSFRIGIWTTNSSNPYGNILDVTTSKPFTPQNFTLGSVGTTSNGNINATNTLKVPIAFQRQDFGTTTIIKVIYQNNFNLTCNMFYEFAQVNKTYINLPSTSYDAGFVQTIFNFNNTVNDVIKVNCKDIITGTEGRYVITQTNFPIKQQVDNFRNGTYGTHGQFGSYDLITLCAIILAMIGLNRLNEAVGAFFTIVLIGVLGYFHIIEWQSILISVIALIVMLAVTQTRKD